MFSGTTVTHNDTDKYRQVMGVIRYYVTLPKTYKAIDDDGLPLGHGRCDNDNESEQRTENEGHNVQPTETTCRLPMCTKEQEGWPTRSDVTEQRVDNKNGKERHNAARAHEVAMMAAHEVTTTTLSNAVTRTHDNDSEQRIDNK